MDFYKSLMVGPGKKVNLDKIDPSDTLGIKKADAEQLTLENIQKLADLQDKLSAQAKHALLIVLQARDAAGKDSTIKHVMGGFNPQACMVHAFKVPSALELSHDFLWRIHRNVPPAGMVGIFNRSHYEDVLVVRVHDLVPRETWQERYEHINAFEANLNDANVHVLKFFLHISKEEQLQRFGDRLNTPSKYWKLAMSDYTERQHWDEYTQAYQDALSKCSKPQAPWFVIPADYKWFRNLAVSSIVVKAMEQMDLKYPKPTADIDAIRQAYMHEVRAQKKGMKK